MTMKPHPATGVMMNEIEVNTGPISEAERLTARLLMADGHPRWVVGAMLGRFPLSFDGTGRKPERPHKVTGGHLSNVDAKNDPRQISMDDFWAELFGEDGMDPKS